MSVSAPPRLPSLVPLRWESAFLGLLLVSVLTGCPSSGDTEDSVREIDPQRSSFTVDRTTDVAGDGKDTVFGTVRIVDTKGAPVLRAEVRIRAKGIGGGEQVFNLPSTNADGITEFELASRGLGTLTMEVIAGLDGRRKTLTQKVEVTFIAGPPAELLFVAFPVQVPAGRTLDVPVMVAARDAAGNAVTRPFPVTLYLAADSTANRLEGTLTVTAVHSRELGRALATFPDVRVLGAGAARLVADSPTSRISSVNFTVYPGPVAGLRFNGSLPEEVEAGAALTPGPSVSTVDAHGNVTTSTTVGVELLLQDAQGHESPLSSIRHDSSPILFPEVRVARAGTGYRLVARSGQLTAATSTPFTVRNGAVEVAASSLRASPQRLPAGPSSRATLRVQLLSRSGNPVADAPVRLSVSGTGHVLVPESGEGRTDAHGVFSATLASESERVAQVTATSGDVVLETEVAFVAECAATTALPYLPTLGDTPPKGSLLPVDLDGDGDLDAVSSEGTVHDNTGDGTLVLRQPDLDRALGHMSAGDLDGDGAPDVLSVGQQVSVRFNRGDGSLFPPRVLVWSAFGDEGRLVDVNGDGKLDVAYLEDQAGWWAVHVLLNQGGGWFAPEVTTAFREDRWFGGRLALVARGPGGGVDLVAMGRGSAPEVFTGGGAGNFVPAGGLTLPEYATALTPADEDGDGREDLFFHLGNGGLALLRNQGQGTFAAPVRLDVGESVWVLTVADFDGDGRKDLAFTAGNLGARLWMVRRDAGGGFRAKEAVGRSFQATGVSAGDLTGDGRPELLVGTPSGVLPLLNQGEGNFLIPGFLLGSNQTSRLGVGDFNGDGVVDLAGMGSFTELLLSQPDGTRTSRLFSTPSSSVRDAIATDLDQDGLMDLVFSEDFNLRMHVLRSTGGGDFAATTLTLTDVVPGPLAAGDLDGDGAPEVVVLHPGQDSATILRNDGTGLLRAGEVLPMGVDPQALALADLDGDEDLDLVVADSEAGTVQRYANDGHGALTLQSTEVVGLAPAALAVGDLDGDGRPEVVVSNRDDGTVSVLSGAGGPARKFPVGSQPRSLALGDFNRDGWQDIAVASEGNLRLALLLGQAGGGFSPPRWQGPMDWPSRLLAHDWDGDGRVDLLAAHSGAVDLLRPTCVR
ncbi:FG-GAP-like repeat-containing protein [Pyxidicoccus trucidator]|uniref:FG-GAP-like repeat-containing protein n=1 Tax=Pyxidicoccus trucidator TaxID=2709662 RepID=UPI0013D97A7C|nr:FG-GAP-like repeat-containing protein [Pyxidicoccus trucidator]